MSRLARMARLREVEHRRAAILLAERVIEHGRLLGLAERSTALADGYRKRDSASTAAALAAMMGFCSGTGLLEDRARADERLACAAADDARTAAVAARRRRELVAERALIEAKLASNKRQAVEWQAIPAAIGTRRA